MLRTSLLTAAFLSIFSLSAGTALAETRNVEVAPFTAASFDSALIATIVVGGPQSILIEAADPANLEDVRVAVRNGQLFAWVDRDFWDVVSFRGGDVTLTITVPSLVGLSASSASQVSATGMTGDRLSIAATSAAAVVLEEVKAESIRLDASSASRLLLSGTCETAHVQASSSAEIQAGKLACVDLNINASSASRAWLFGTGLVSADASSGAFIELAGHPRHVDDDVNSGADIDVLQ